MQSNLGCEATKWCCRWPLHDLWGWSAMDWEQGPTDRDKTNMKKTERRRRGEERRNFHLTTFTVWSHDPETIRLSPRVWLQSTVYTCTHVTVRTPVCVCLCVCKHVCVTSCVCSLATLSGALWLAVSHSWRLPSPPPATKMCSLASLHATSNRPSLHSQLRHTHTRMT